MPRAQGTLKLQRMRQRGSAPRGARLSCRRTPRCLSGTLKARRCRTRKPSSDTTLSLVRTSRMDSAVFTKRAKPPRHASVTTLSRSIDVHLLIERRAAFCIGMCLALASRLILGVRVLMEMSAYLHIVAKRSLTTLPSTRHAGVMGVAAGEKVFVASLILRQRFANGHQSVIPIGP